jgi:protein-tyrosine phosphatase
VIDLHSHILPAVDDGARDLAESIEIAHAAVADGIAVVAATPHVRADFPTTAEAMEQGVAALREALAAAGVTLEVRTGGELALDRLDILPLDELRRFGLAGNPAYLLVEAPYYGWPLDLPPRVARLRSQGVTAVIAHPERNADVQADRELLRPLVDAGALVQVTAASLDGRLGRGTRNVARELIESGLVHLLASDAHSAGLREVGMSRAAEAVGDEALADWLTTAVPAAIAAGNGVPERPQRRRRRFRSVLRSR